MLDPAQGFSNKGTTLKLKAPDGRLLALSPEPDEGRRTSQVFTELLPPGRYQVVGLVGGMLRFTVSLEELDLKFEVRKGHLTNLGTLIYQPTGNREYTLLRYPTNNDISEFLKVSYPAW